MKQDQEVVVRHITTMMRANAVFKTFRRSYDIDIPTVSQANYAALQADVLPLHVGEQRLYDLVTQQMVYSHGSESVGGLAELSSLKVRQYSSAFTGNRNTAASSATDGNIFFTAELGNDPSPPSFLGEAIDFVRINPSVYQRSHSVSALAFAWISPHLSEYSAKTHHRAGFGSTHYKFWHDDKPLRKTYLYQYSDGTTHQSTVDFSDEIFMGGQVQPAIALLLIRHLRLLKNEYSETLYKKLCDDALSDQDKIKLLYEVMKHTWPSQMFPEVKVPGKLDITKGVGRHHQKEAQELKSALNYMSSFFQPYSCMVTPKALTPVEQVIELIKAGQVEALVAVNDIKTIIREIDAGNCGSVMYAVIYLNKSSHCIPMLNALLDLDARFPMRDYSDGLMRKAIEANNMKLLGWLLKLVLPNKLDAQLHAYHRVNYAHIGPFSDPISHACELGNIKALEMLVAAGAQLTRFPQFWCSLAARKGHLSVLEYFVQQGIDLSPSSGRYTAPLLEFTRHKYVDGARFMLAQKCDVNESYPHKDSDFACTALHFAVKHQDEAMVALLLEQPDIKVNAMNASQETAWNIAYHQGNESLQKQLIGAGADTSMLLAERPCYDHFSRYAVAVVTGIDAQGDAVVVLGKKWSRAGGMINQYLFPGGLMENSDVSFEHAAAREFAEETHVPLPELIAQGLVTIKVLHRYINGTDNTMCSTVFVQFDLGEALEKQLSKTPLIAQDDLAYVTCLPLYRLIGKVDSSAGVTTHEIEGVPLLPSNGWVLAGLNTQKDVRQEFEFSCDVEQFGRALVQRSVRDNNLSLLKRLVAYGASVRCEVYSKNSQERYTLFAYACCFAEPAMLDYLLQHYKKTELGGMPHPVALIVREHPEPLTLLKFLAARDALTEIGYLQGLYQAIKDNKDDLAIYCIQQSPGVANKLVEGFDYPLTVATEHGRDQVVYELIKQGADLNPKHIGEPHGGIVLESPLMQAIHSGKRELFDYYLKQGANVNQYTELSTDDEGLMRLQRSVGIFSGCLSSDPLDMMRSFGMERGPKKQCPLLSALYYARSEMATTLFNHPNIDLDLAAKCVHEWINRPMSYYCGSQSPIEREIIQTLLARHENTLQSQQDSEATAGEEGSDALTP